MSVSNKPLVICAPYPRTLDLIFAPAKKAMFFEKYEIVQTGPDEVEGLPDETLKRARYIVGQPPLGLEALQKMDRLKCIFNVEGNLLNNMDYDYLFKNGIHIVTTSSVFALPVAEMGLGLALCLARDVIDADLDFRNAKELWGGDGNKNARLISDAKIGIVGFGDLGQTLAGLLAGFNSQISVFDPWLPPMMIKERGGRPAGLDQVLAQSDFVFVTASVTSENIGFLNAASFATMKQGAAFILLSRADVVNFTDLMAAVSSGHIVAASDVFPEEPLARDHPVRTLKGFIHSAHRAGAMDSVFKKMGEMVLEDMDLMNRDLPPL
ncbi:Hydroxypyruvate reductase, partial [hydrothermal vent metagenome]